MCNEMQEFFRGSSPGEEEEKAIVTDATDTALEPQQCRQTARGSPLKPPTNDEAETTAAIVAAARRSRTRRLVGICSCPASLAVSLTAEEMERKSAAKRGGVKRGRDDDDEDVSSARAPLKRALPN
jgi:hypothetical protein